MLRGCGGRQIGLGFALWVLCRAGTSAWLGPVFGLASGVRVREIFKAGVERGVVHRLIIVQDCQIPRLLLSRGGRNAAFGDTHLHRKRGDYYYLKKEMPYQDFIFGQGFLTTLPEGGTEAAGGKAAPPLHAHRG